MRVHIKAKLFGAGTVLRNLSLDLVPGDLLAILGASGAGKTTFLRIAAGLDTDFEGAVEGRPRRIGFQFQSPALLPWRSALQNVTLACGSEDLAFEWLDWLELGHAAALLPQQLSLGMARRVSLARALSVAPQLLLLDEPTAGLDRKSAARVHEVLREAMTRFRPITLIATHAPREAIELT